MRSLHALALVAALAAAPAAASPAAAAPPNDDFDGATPITALPYSTQLDARGATVAADDPSTCAEGYSVWYRFTPAVTARVGIDTLGSNFHTAIGVYTGTRGSLAEVTCNVSYQGSQQSLVRFDAVAGTTYHVFVATPWVGSHPFDLRLAAYPAPRPANDDFANAHPVAELPFAHEVDAAEASVEPDDPTNCRSGPSSWYAYEATFTGRLELRSGSAVGVYTGTRGALQPVVCKDFAWTSDTYRIRFAVVSGTTYFISVYGPRLELDAAPPLPPNDEPAGAIPITSLPFTHMLDTVEATQSSGDPQPCGYGAPPFPSVWYAFTAPRTMRVRVTTEGTDYRHSLAVLAGAPGALTEVACGWGGVGYTEPDLTFAAGAGKTYFLVVSGWERGGNLTVSLPLVNSLSLERSRPVVPYGRAALLEGRLEAFADTEQRAVALYARPIGGARVLLGTTAVDSAGRFAFPVRPRVHTTYTAEWAGDGRYPALSSPAVTIRVRAVATTTLTGWYRVAGGVRLYRPGSSPRIVAAVSPTHAGRFLFIHLSVLDRGRWSEPRGFRFRIPASGKVVAFLQRPPAGVTFRVRTEFRSDADHLGALSPWVRLRVAG